MAKWTMLFFDEYTIYNLWNNNNDDIWAFFYFISQVLWNSKVKEFWKKIPYIKYSNDSSLDSYHY